jgi:O-acetyl-ADP-ribose deacetylase
MKIEVRHGNIVTDTADCDAIVNAANPRLLGGGGVDGAIHRAAGPKLRAYCETIEEVEPGVRCRVGEVVVTPAFRLPHKAILHTVGPMFPGARPIAFPGENLSLTPEKDLADCVRGCLKMADRSGYYTLALPAISCGVYGCSIWTFVSVAKVVLSERDWDLDKVVFVIFEEPDLKLFEASLNILGGW